MNTKTPPWLATALLVSLVLIAWGLRLYHLGIQSLWLDEGFSWDIARQGPFGILHVLAGEDRHPPLHYLALWLMMRLAGSSGFSLRFLSAGAGTLAVPLVYWIGRRLNGVLVGLAAAALIAISPFQIWYSQEARMYALLMTLGLFSIVFVLLGTDRQYSPPRHWPALGYVVSTVGALYTHYYAVFLLPAQAAIVIGRDRWPICWKRWIWWPVFAMLLFSPWTLAIRQQYLRASDGHAPPIEFFLILQTIVMTYTTGENAVAGASWIAGAAALLAILGIVAGLERLGGQSGGHLRDGLALLGWLMASPVGASLATAVLGTDIRANGRMYYIVGLPPFALLVARGMVTLGAAAGFAFSHVRSRGQPRFPPIVAAGITAIGVGAAVVVQQPIVRNQYFDRPKEDFRAAARYIRTHEWPTDGVILDAEYIFHPFVYYYHGTSPWFRAVVEPGRVDEAMARLTAGHDRIWLVLSHAEFADPENRVENWLKQRAAVLDDEWYAGVHVRLFGFQPSPRTVAPAMRQSLTVSFDGTVELTGVNLPSRVIGGHSLPIKLVWHPRVRIGESDHVVLQMVSEDGQVWAQTDHVPIGPLNLPTQWQPGEYLIDYCDLPVPLGSPSGTYRILLKLYAPSTGRTLEPLGGRDTVEIGFVEVDPSITSRPLDGQDVAPNLRLVSASLGATQARQGETVPVELLWQATAPTTRVPPVEVRLVDRRGQVVSAQSVDLQTGRHPVTSWRPNEAVRVQEPLLVPRRLEAGVYQVEAGATTYQTIGPLTVVATRRSYSAPAIEHRQQATFGGSFALLGFDLEPSVLQPGATLSLVLYWRALADPTADYTVFTHVVGPDGRIYGQHDGEPVGGTRPTSGWLAGEVIRDPHALAIDQRAPPGTYTLEIGLYQPGSGVRLPVVMPSSQDGRLILAQRVEVATPP